MNDFTARPDISKVQRQAHSRFVVITHDLADCYAEIDPECCGRTRRSPPLPNIPYAARTRVAQAAYKLAAFTSTCSNESVLAEIAEFIEKRIQPGYVAKREGATSRKAARAAHTVVRNGLIKRIQAIEESMKAHPPKDFPPTTLSWDGSVLTFDEGYGRLPVRKATNSVMLNAIDRLEKPNSSKA